MIKLNIQRFASTNKTANYELSQYVDTDKPSYLGDYNSDMEKIDNAIHTNATNISGVDAKAETAKTTADTALGNANDADSKATTAQSTATSALEKATKAERDITKLDLTTYEEINLSTINLSYGSINTSRSSIRIAKNSDGSICKVYGNIYITGTGNHSEINIVTFQTSLRPSEKIVINSGCLSVAKSDVIIQDHSFVENIYGTNLELDTSGVVTIKAGIGGRIQFVYLPPCLYYLKNFGDQ